MIRSPEDIARELREDKRRKADAHLKWRKDNPEKLKAIKTRYKEKLRNDPARIAKKREYDSVWRKELTNMRRIYRTIDRNEKVLQSVHPPTRPAVKTAGSIQFEKGTRTRIGGTTESEGIHLASASGAVTTGHRERLQDVGRDASAIQQSARAPFVAAMGGTNLRAREDDPY